MGNRNREIQEIVAALCGALSGLGCEYHFEAGTLAHRRSYYIYVRRPKYMEIRISDHAANKIRHRKRFDVGPHGMTLEQATREITELVTN